MPETTTSTFEKAFSSIAHAHINDKAPKLSKYEVGFQLIEKNEDDTRGVGVIGYKVGDVFVLVPIFFINGNIRGTDVMYVKNFDILLPFTERWVDELLFNKGQLGRAITKDLQSLGVATPFYMTVTRPPYKYGSFHGDFVHDFIVLLGRTCYADIDKDISFKNVKKFTNLADTYPLQTLKYLTKAALYCPEIIKGIDIFYPKFIDKLLKKAKNQLNSRNRLRSVLNNQLPSLSQNSLLTNPLVKKSNYKNTNLTNLEIYHAVKNNLLTIDDYKQLQQFGIIFSKEAIAREEEKQKNEIVINVKENFNLYSPNTTNIYSTLISPNRFKKCLIAINPALPYGRLNAALIVDLSNKHFDFHHKTKIYVRDVPGRNVLRDYLNDLSTPASLPKDTIFMLISENDATVPLRVLEEYSGDEAAGQSEVYIVEPVVPQSTLKDLVPFSNYGKKHYDDIVYLKKDVDYDIVGYDRASNEKDLDQLSYARLLKNKKSTNNQISDFYKPFRLILLKRPGRKLLIHSDGLYVPDSFKILKLGSEAEVVRPDNPINLAMKLASSAEYIKIAKFGDKEFLINNQLFDFSKALNFLCDNKNLSIKTSIKLLKEALETGKVEVLVKKARNTIANLTTGGPSAPRIPDEMFTGVDTNFPGQTYVTQPSMAVNLPVQEASALLTDRSVYDPTVMPDTQLSQVVQKAVQLGNKDIFDVSNLSILLNAADLSLVDEFIPDLIKGVDKLGRILIMLYWHFDKFVNRYGLDDVRKLENLLREAIKRNGDLILDLRQKELFKENFGFNPNVAEVGRTI